MLIIVILKMACSIYVGPTLYILGNSISYRKKGFCTRFLLQINHFRVITFHMNVVWSIIDFT